MVATRREAQTVYYRIADPDFRNLDDGAFGTFCRER